jgi:hypothetical protein
MTFASWNTCWICERYRVVSGRMVWDMRSTCILSTRVRVIQVSSVIFTWEHFAVLLHAHNKHESSCRVTFRHSTAHIFVTKSLAIWFGGDPLRRHVYASVIHSTQSFIPSMMVHWKIRISPSALTTWVMNENKLRASLPCDDKPRDKHGSYS